MTPEQVMQAARSLDAELRASNGVRTSIVDVGPVSYLAITQWTLTAAGWHPSKRDFVMVPLEELDTVSVRYAWLLAAGLFADLPMARTAAQEAEAPR